MPSVKELAAQFAPEESDARKVVVPTPSKFEKYAKSERERERRHEYRRLRGRHSHDGRRRQHTHRGPTKPSKQISDMLPCSKQSASDTFAGGNATKSSTMQVAASAVEPHTKKPTKQTSQSSQSTSNKFAQELLAKRSNRHIQITKRVSKRTSTSRRTINSYSYSNSSNKSSNNNNNSCIKKEKAVIARQNDGRRKLPPSTTAPLPPKQAMLLAMLMAPPPPRRRRQSHAQTQSRTIFEQQPTRLPHSGRKSPVALTPAPLTASTTSTTHGPINYLRARLDSSELATTTRPTKPRTAFLAPPATSGTTNIQQQNSSKPANQHNPTSQRVMKPRKTSATVLDVLGSIGARFQRKKRDMALKKESHGSRVQSNNSTCSDSGSGSPPGLGNEPKPFSSACPLFLNVPVEENQHQDVAPPPGLDHDNKPIVKRLSQAYRRRVSISPKTNRLEQSGPVHSKRKHCVASQETSDAGTSRISSDEVVVELPVKRLSFLLALRNKRKVQVQQREPASEPVAMQPLGLTSPRSHDIFRTSLAVSKRASARRPTTRPLSVPRRSGMSCIVSSRMSASTFGMNNTDITTDSDFQRRDAINSTTDWAVRLSKGISSNFGGKLEFPLNQHRGVSVASPASIPWHEDVALQPVAPAHGSLASMATDPWLLDDVQQYELFCNSGGEKVDESGRLSQQRISKRYSGTKRVVSAPRGFDGLSGAVEAMERREVALQADIAAFLMAKDPVEFGNVRFAQALVSRCAIGKMVGSLKDKFDDTPVWWDEELVSQIVDVV